MSIIDTKGRQAGRQSTNRKKEQMKEERKTCRVAIIITGLEWL
jgi:hypothetical protein